MMSHIPAPKTRFDVVSARPSAHECQARCKQARLTLDTDLAGNPQAFDSAELLLAALSACMIKGLERGVPMPKSKLRGVEVGVHGVRQDVPPKMESIRYEIVVDADESDRRLALPHDNVKKSGTVFDTVAPGAVLTGVLRRQEVST